MNCTLSFESFCKHCKNCTAFVAINVPDNLPEEILTKLLDERSVDCCYTCYELVESTQPAVAESAKKLLKT